MHEQISKQERKHVSLYKSVQAKAMAFTNNLQIRILRNVGKSIYRCNNSTMLLEIQILLS